ncbi:DUF3606 domain-containing protein [Pseudacidovorax intermedius]|uniref:DUF3606 domain-containing protein n=1 Tax=Pseudacidovorax intermedius TaxID=433924 RepID=A0A147GNV9_9BURK|nr:DUF3606 domain-containing protein [Pseudacidovorax intermedius]KTT15551.1 hypothetical protein NS331_20315 [Pseudacidovorax intermedius]
MPDDHTLLAPAGNDPDRIDMQSDAAVAEWARRMDIDETRLRAAVAAVGDRATDVARHLAGGGAAPA